MGLLIALGQRAVHQLLERGSYPEQFLDVREDRPMAVPHSHATKGELDDSVVLAVLNLLTADSVPASGTASQLGLDPRLVPAAREVPGLQEFGLGIPAADLVVQERLEQSGRPRVDRLPQRDEVTGAALA
ncbi:hypothetical protein [Streptomyces sp. EN27]|uniref:hypothetical protein n=1 Tax=Streptomyces sp. EN27 TaxID=211464 RepID=UPI000851C429|nr:hypothetical protein [Streptomyces sp. EN27]